jgi:hypothetical protein
VKVYANVAMPLLSVTGLGRAINLLSTVTKIVPVGAGRPATDDTVTVKIWVPPSKVLVERGVIAVVVVARAGTVTVRPPVEARKAPCAT